MLIEAPDTCVNYSQTQEGKSAAEFGGWCRCFCRRSSVNAETLPRTPAVSPSMHRSYNLSGLPPGIVLQSKKPPRLGMLSLLGSTQGIRGTCPDNPTNSAAQRGLRRNLSLNLASDAAAFDVVLPSLPSCEKDQFTFILVHWGDNCQFTNFPVIYCVFCMAICRFGGYHEIR